MRYGNNYNMEKQVYGFEYPEMMRQFKDANFWKQVKDFKYNDPMAFSPAMLKQRQKIFETYMKGLGAKGLSPADLEYTSKTKTSATQFIATVMPGKQQEVMEQIIAFFEKYQIGIRGAQIPTIDSSGQLRLNTTQEKAPLLATWLEDPRVAGRAEHEMYIVPQKNKFLGGAQDGSNINWSEITKHGRLGIPIHPEQVAVETKKLIAEYTKKLSKESASNKEAKEMFNIEGFNKFVQERAKTGKGDKKYLTEAVAKNIRKKKDEFTQDAREEYIKLIKEILQGKSGTINEFNWAIDQFTNAEYMFSEINEHGEPTKLEFRGELSIGGGTVDIAEFKFQNSKIHDVKRDDMKGLINAGQSAEGSKHLDQAPSAKFMQEINQNASSRCNEVQEKLGFKTVSGKQTTKLDDNVWHNLGGKTNGMELFRSTMRMMRQRVKTAEQATEQTVEKKETKKTTVEPNIERHTDIKHYTDGCEERRA